MASEPVRARLRVAACQSLCLQDDFEGNLHRVARAAEAAADAGAQIACFPETTLLGWVNPNAHHLAPAIPGAWSDCISLLARQHEMMFCIGMAEKDGDDLYDSAVLIGADGRILLKHRKVNTLVQLLSPPYSRGELQHISVAQTQLGKIGVLICADTFVDEVLSCMAGLEPDLLLVPYGWAAEPAKWPKHGENLARVVCHAAQTVGCTVVGTDCVGAIAHGPWTGQTFGGQSVVADARGEILAVAKDREPDIIVIDV